MKASMNYDYCKRHVASMWHDMKVKLQCTLSKEFVLHVHMYTCSISVLLTNILNQCILNKRHSHFNNLDCHYMLYCRTCTTFNETGLVLGNAPIRFRHQAHKLFFPKLLNLVTSNHFRTTEHAIAFYTLLYLVTIEFLTVGINDILILMMELENVALEMSFEHGNFIHACVAGCLHLVSLVSEDNDLVDHLKNIINKRSDSGTDYLMPASLTKIKKDFSASDIESYVKPPKSLLFNLIQKGFISHPVDISRNSSMFATLINN